MRGEQTDTYKKSVDARNIDTGMMVWSQTYVSDDFEALDKQWQIKLLPKIHLIYFDLNILLMYCRKFFVQLYWAL